MASHRLTEAAERAVAALRDLRRAAAAECGGADADDRAPFRIEWDGAETPEALAARVLEAAAETAAAREAVRPGHVYCYDCQTATCAHTRPSLPEEVFAGYEATGRPRWCEFFNFLLDLGDRRTDLLFARSPQVLACLVDGQTLCQHQLPSFGRHSLTYRIWAQAAAGYLHVGTARCAVTVQLVEGAGRELSLQVVAPEKLAESLAETEDSERSSLSRVHDALDDARREVRALSVVWKRSPSGPGRHALRERGLGIMRHLVHSIERKGRQQAHRTQHAEVRAAQHRPVHKAREDALAAPTASFFHDVAKSAVIVVGRAGRAHAFTAAGRLITSLTIGGDEVESRQRRRRYVPLTEEEVARFRACCQSGGPEAALDEGQGG